MYGSQYIWYSLGRVKAMILSSSLSNKSDRMAESRLKPIPVTFGWKVQYTTTTTDSPLHAPLCIKT